MKKSFKSLLHACSVTQSCPALRPMDSSPPGFSVHGVFPGKNTEMSCHFLLQGIFSTQGSNPCLMYWQVDSLPPCYLGSLIFDMVKLKSIICFLFVLVYLSVQFSRSVMSDSLQPHELQHVRPPCPSPTPRVHPNPCPLSR